MDASKQKSLGARDLEPLEARTAESVRAEPPSSDVSGIPDAPVGTPKFGASAHDYDVGAPVGPTPRMDFWEAVYGRRSVRKFKPDAVSREALDQIMHAGIWAPSSCNYQMWDLVAVDDSSVNAKLASLSAQMGNAPVNIVVSYGREFSEEGWANVQSASAMIENMSLAAHVLGLGTFWITQMGDREKVREIVGLPYDRLVIAVLAVGYPKFAAKAGPKRRPLSVVAHYNHYTGKPIPSSSSPTNWSPDDLANYQRARVLNGLRHNKPRPWETRALVTMLERFVPDGKSEPASVDAPRKWLDVLPCTGILTERISRERRGYRFDVVERSADVGQFVAERTIPHAGAFEWPNAGATPHEPPSGAYDVVSCLFRAENLAPRDRASLFRNLARWTKPGGNVIVGFVSKRSFHDWTERLREQRGGPRGVEYVLAPDPNIGPFEALAPSEVVALASDAGLDVADRLGLQAVPQPDEIEFRARNFSKRAKQLAHLAAGALGLAERLPGAQARFGRFQFVKFIRRA